MAACVRAWSAQQTEQLSRPFHAKRAPREVTHACPVSVRGRHDNCIAATKQDTGQVVSVRLGTLSGTNLRPSLRQRSHPTWPALHFIVQVFPGSYWLPKRGAMLTRGGVGASGRHWLKWLCTSMSEVGVTGNSCSGVSGHSEISELTLSTSSNRWLRLPSCCCCGRAQGLLRLRRSKGFHEVWRQRYSPRQISR